MCQAVEGLLGLGEKDWAFVAKRSNPGCLY